MWMWQMFCSCHYFPNVTHLVRKLHEKKICIKTKCVWKDYFCVPFGSDNIIYKFIELNNRKKRCHIRILIIISLYLVRKDIF